MQTMTLAVDKVADMHVAPWLKRVSVSSPAVPVKRAFPLAPTLFRQ
jgi:hypothetical protein